MDIQKIAAIMGHTLSVAERHYVELQHLIDRSEIDALDFTDKKSG